MSLCRREGGEEGGFLFLDSALCSAHDDPSMLVRVHDRPSLSPSLARIGSLVPTQALHGRVSSAPVFSRPILRSPLPPPPSPSPPFFLLGFSIPPRPLGFVLPAGA